MPFIDDVIDSVTPKNVPLSARYKRSFGYTTVQSRLPVIITQIVDYLSRNKDEIVKEVGEVARDDVKMVTGLLSKLKHDLQTNKSLELLSSDGPDVAIWNDYFNHTAEVEGADPRWYYSPWLYVECYMYRRIREMFELSTSLQSMDPFRKQKEDALYNSMTTISFLSSYIMKLFQRPNELRNEEVRRELIKLIHVNLWGNRCDLSISSGADIVLTEDPLLKVNELNDCLLVNDAEKVWDTLCDNVNGSDAIVDIVMDNAGYELFTDLCLADFLCTFGLAGKICFHAKVLPWYISDTMVHDFHWTIERLAESKISSLCSLAVRWHGYLRSGKWTLQADTFWTLPHDYSMMKKTDPDLYNSLGEASLVIFKGDLNYRKLTGDINWDPTEPFSKALQGFHPTKLITLRTLKADVICGLAPGQAELISAKSEDWLISGQYAVIQFDG
ncbi:damage-control phosphatase ARMT1 isoform X2 [Anabrus simplex]|uniref:damage-control phosphatase ARMT1 isoform X2 n=1 Tax=Anabrus simplex TaxID=316456 RepID=UPI0035A3A248